jgi:hypothetical protein
VLKVFQVGAELVLIAAHVFQIRPRGQEHAPQLLVLSP